MAAWAQARRKIPRWAREELEWCFPLSLLKAKKVETPSCYGMLAELEPCSFGAEQALSRIDRGLAISEETGSESPILYLLSPGRGDILLKCDPANPAPAQDAYS